MVRFIWIPKKKFIYQSKLLNLSFPLHSSYWGSSCTPALSPSPGSTGSQPSSQSWTPCKGPSDLTFSKQSFINDRETNHTWRTYFFNKLFWPTIIIQAGTELCPAQLKLALSLFCFWLAQPTELELDWAGLSWARYFPWGWVKVEIKAISAQPTELELNWAGLSWAWQLGFFCCCRILLLTSFLRI